MSITQIENKIKSLQSEIARLNKQNTAEAGKEAKALEVIKRTQKLIYCEVRSFQCQHISQNRAILFDLVLGDIVPDR